jgi:hypothetical protein
MSDDEFMNENEFNEENSKIKNSSNIINNNNNKNSINNLLYIYFLVKQLLMKILIYFIKDYYLYIHFLNLEEYKIIIMILIILMKLIKIIIKNLI